MKLASRAHNSLLCGRKTRSEKVGLCDVHGQMIIFATGKDHMS